MYILDTNVVSEIRKLARADRHVINWLEQAVADEMFLSVITVKELEYGVLRKERADPAQGKILRRWLVEYLWPEFSGRILHVDESVAKRCAHLHVPDKRPEADALIAATAWVHGMKIVTRNVGDFLPMGVGVINPWEY